MSDFLMHDVYLWNMESRTKRDDLRSLILGVLQTDGDLQEFLDELFLMVAQQLTKEFSYGVSQSGVICAKARTYEGGRGAWLLSIILLEGQQTPIRLLYNVQGRDLTVEVGACEKRSTRELMKHAITALRRGQQNMTCGDAATVMAPSRKPIDGAPAPSASATPDEVARRRAAFCVVAGSAVVASSLS